MNCKFEPWRYEGQWYEIARYPNWFQTGCVQSTAFYRWNGNEMEIQNICRLENNTYTEIRGIASIYNPSYPCRLMVDFDEGYQGQYWVLWTDYDKWALVSNENKTNFWILSRTPSISEADFKLLITYAQQLGYTNKLIITQGAISDKKIF
jgi:apolipoprotein D and lipocalin family protein